MSSYRAAATSHIVDSAASVLTELDAGRQLRRLRRTVRFRSGDDELRAAVAGKRVLVTGASSGIGRAVAAKLLAAGAEVLLVARRADLLDELVREAHGCGGSATAYPCDLSDRDQVAALVETVLAEHGGVDVLINNAGRSIRRTLHDTVGRMHDYERVMQLNFFGAVWLTAPVVEQMRRNGGGHVINVSTMGTQFYGTPRFGAYMASKGALDQFADSVAPETLADGVNWTTVHMPLVQTEMIAPAQDTWNSYPKLSLDTGAAMVLDAVVRAPARVVHPLGTLTAALERWTPKLMLRYKARQFPPTTDPAALPRVAIIGAGMSGLAMGLKLRAAGVEDFVIYEKSHTVGGTWRENTYPGLACDVFAHFYCYRDVLQPDWTRLFAPGGEIRDYFEKVADSRELRSYIRFNSEITSGRFEDGRWKLRTADGREESADILVCATGVLHRPRLPDIAGLDQFQGKVFHSARWDHSTTTDGARIGIIGTGSTGVQLTAALAPEAERLTVFQRTPQWVVPLPNPRIPQGVRTALRRVPALNRAAYNVTSAIYARLGNAPIRDGWERRLMSYLARRALSNVADPDLRARLTPPDQPMCKRLVSSPDFYHAVQRPNVDVVTAGIDHVCAEGVVTSDGTLHSLDVLVLATGFDAQAYMRPMQLSGPSGQTLDDVWRDGPRAHHTTTVPGLPNLFMLMGPNSPIGNASLVPIAEAQADYVIWWMRRMRERGIVEVEPTSAATTRFYDEVTAAMGDTVWVTGCDSWYLGPDGVPLLFPWSLREFRRLMAHPRLEDFIVRTAPSQPAALEPVG